MGTSKTIALSETAYEHLKDRKHEGESFSDVVERLAGERSLLEFAGTASQEDNDELRAGVQAARESTNSSVEQTYRQLADSVESSEEPDDS